MSMLAATICSSVMSPAARREKRLVRGEDRADARVAAVRIRLDRDPVAYRRIVDSCRRAVAHPAGNAGQALAFRRQDAVDVRVLETDARRHQTTLGVRRELLCPADGPPQGGQVNRHRRLHYFVL